MTRLRDDSGMTLIEILIVVLIMSVIIGPIAASTILGYRTIAASQTRLTLSHDRQLMQIYLGRDLASTTTAKTGIAAGCKDDHGNTIATTPALVLTWPADRQADGTWRNTYEADYVVETTGVGANAVKTLNRYLCANGGTALSKTTVSHKLSNTTPPTAAIDNTTGVVTVTVTDGDGLSYKVTGQERA